MHMALATWLTAVVTVLALVMYLWTGFRAGGMRGRHGIVAPAVTGHPEFERAYRVQMNTLEQIVVFLPLLWLSNTYFAMLPMLTPALGLVWIVGRIIYALAYQANPSSRSLGFTISGLAMVGLLVTTIIGLVQAFLAINAA
jgi:glutathione S-transferase